MSGKKSCQCGGVRWSVHELEGAVCSVRLLAVCISSSNPFFPGTLQQRNVGGRQLWSLWFGLRNAIPLTMLLHLPEKQEKNQWLLTFTVKCSRTDEERMPSKNKLQRLHSIHDMYWLLCMGQVMLNICEKQDAIVGLLYGTWFYIQARKSAPGAGVTSGLNPLFIIQMGIKSKNQRIIES